MIGYTVGQGRNPAHRFPVRRQRPSGCGPADGRLFVLAHAEAPRDAKDDDRPERLREVEGPAHHAPALVRRRGLEHGDFGEGGEETAVLLILRPPCPGVVAHQDYQSGVYAGHVQNHEGVQRDVHTHALHAHEHAAASLGDARGNVERDAFVQTPLGIVAVFAGSVGERGKGACTRRTGISGHATDACLDRAPGPAPCRH